MHHEAVGLFSQMKERGFLFFREHSLSCSYPVQNEWWKRLTRELNRPSCFAPQILVADSAEDGVGGFQWIGKVLGGAAVCLCGGVSYDSA